MYNPIVAILVAAEKATIEPKLGRARMNARVAASQMVRTGLWNLWSTWSKKRGSARSRLKAYIMRELLVMEKRPQCQTHTMTRVMAATAPLGPNTSTKIWTTGCPYLEVIVRWKFWMLKSRQRSRKKPKTADTATDVMTPTGAFLAASLVSSERCADASNPGRVVSNRTNWK
jgi:hypothetical protein